MIKCSLIQDDQMKLKMPYSLNENRELIESPDFFGGAELPVVTVSDFREDKLTVLETATYSSGILETDLKTGITLAKAEKALQGNKYLEFIILVEQLQDDDETPDGYLSVVVGWLNEK